MEFTGLIAFPLTPLTPLTSPRGGAVDDAALARIVGHVAEAGADAIAVLGSTGIGAYLNRAERAAVVRTAVGQAGGTPVLAGVSALRTADVLAHARDAAKAGAAGLLLSVMTYQPLTDDEIMGMFEDVAAATDLPVVLYDNPTTTHVTMDPALYGRIAAAGGVRDVKIPGVPMDEDAMRGRLAGIRAAVPVDTGIGISGDAMAVTGLLSGCDAWHSAIGGTLPERAVRLTRAALSDDAVRQGWARAESARLAPLWDLMRRHGSLRVAAVIAALRGWVELECLPRPVRPLPEPVRAEVADVVRALGLT